MFKDTEDFIRGINRIAICKVISGVEVWVFTLMDNHVHFLLYGTMYMCKRFIDKYKLLTGKWISHKYGLSGYLKELPASIIPLRTEEEIIEVAAYIDRNSIVAGFNGLPAEYRWSSSSIIFKDKSGHSGRCLKDFSLTQLRDMLKTRVTLPGAWTMNKDMMIDPRCFTEWKKVETLYKTPMRYLYYVTKKLEGKINMALSQGQKTFILDKDLRHVTADLSQKHFGKDDIRKLDINSRLVLARILRRNYASTPKQIARMLHLNVEVLKGFV